MFIWTKDTCEGIRPNVCQTYGKLPEGLSVCLCHDLFSVRFVCGSILYFQDILDFLSQMFGDTDKVQEVADSVKKLKLSVTPEEVAKLAEDIKKALNSLTGIDDILEETEERLNIADDLKGRAEKAR